MRLAIVILLAACHSATPHRWRADAGPATFSDQRSFLGGLHWAEYLDASRTLPRRVVKLIRALPGASAMALYGINVVTGGKNVSWAIDGDTERGYRFVFDANADGDLANDEVHLMTRTGTAWTAEITLLPRHAGHPSLHERIQFDGRSAAAYTDVIRRGTIEVDGRLLPFAISCEPDCTETDTVVVGFDLDGDGKVDLDEGSPERYRLSGSERAIVIGERTYMFEVSRDGSGVTLRPSDASRTARPSLQAGTRAPDFELVVSGAHHELAELRGQRVLLDFTAIGCHFCVEDLPWLTRARARGVDVVTIATRDTSGDLVDPQHARWVTIEASDPGPIASLYRVQEFPTYFLIDRDGTLVCSRCKHGAIDAALDRLGL